LISLIPKFGYRKSLLIGVMLEITACILMAVSPSFLTARLFFVLIGSSFAFIKISVYSSVSLVTENVNEHASFISFIDGFFTIGLIVVFWLFGFIMGHWPWTYTYWIIAILCSFGLILLLTTPASEYEPVTKTNDTKHAVIKNTSFARVWRLLVKQSVWMFLLLAFIYVFIEQGLTTWLPTYDEKVLHIISNYSVEIAGLFAAGLVVGKFAAALIIRLFNWQIVLFGCAVFALTILFITIYLSGLLPAHIPHAYNHWSNIPKVAFLIPFFGVAIGPIYPILCSSILSRQSADSQSTMSSLIMISSALGGTIGSRIVGTLFGVFGGLTAIKAPIMPLIIVILLIFPYYHYLKKIVNEE
jgi:FHS family glucose/mannose:H+ symporter-like MFS transporter